MSVNTFSNSALSPFSFCASPCRPAISHCSTLNGFLIRAANQPRSFPPSCFERKSIIHHKISFVVVPIFWRKVSSITSQTVGKCFATTAIVLPWSQSTTVSSYFWSNKGSLSLFNHSVACVYISLDLVPRSSRCHLSTEV